MLITAAPEARTVDIPPTATSGVPASHISHSARPSPSHQLKSERQKKAPVGLIVGVAIAILAGVIGLFLVRWLFVRRARRRAAFAGQGRTLGGPAAPRSSTGKQPPVSQPQAYPAPPQAYTMPAPQLPPASERDAVELGAYPPPTQSPAPPQLPPTHTSTGSWSTPFAGAGSNTAEPGAGSSSAARQAYLAAELRAAQTQLERGGKGADTKAIKARIRALEERQQSAWALGLE
ncbi:hypothetical protein C8F04DRAFT_1272753 [Mycena alexandri]|uniref:Transmembrane protein n=1 Tax=Mycena alexandri TaxID=1745969 RepID=A0AAD6S9R3_9AGAR|nr:hypothetical protein C8F04DRAFT_1272753 [Mycena alexandri]